MIRSQGPRWLDPCRATGGRASRLPVAEGNAQDNDSTKLLRNGLAHQEEQGHFYVYHILFTGISIFFESDSSIFFKSENLLTVLYITNGVTNIPIVIDMLSFIVKYISHPNQDINKNIFGVMPVRILHPHGIPAKRYPNRNLMPMFCA